MSNPTNSASAHKVSAAFKLAHKAGLKAISIRTDLYDSWFQYMGYDFHQPLSDPKENREHVKLDLGINVIRGKHSERNPHA